MRKPRPDLAFTVVDSHQTGLALVTNLDPQSTVLIDDYAVIDREMLSFIFRGNRLRKIVLYAQLGIHRRHRDKRENGAEILALIPLKAVAHGA